MVCGLTLLYNKCNRRLKIVSSGSEVLWRKHENKESIMGLCDLCNKPVGSDAKHYSALKKKTAMQVGGPN